MNHTMYPLLSFNFSLMKGANTSICIYTHFTLKYPCDVEQKSKFYVFVNH